MSSAGSFAYTKTTSIGSVAAEAAASVSVVILLSVPGWRLSRDNLTDDPSTSSVRLSPGAIRAQLSADSARATAARVRQTPSICPRANSSVRRSRERRLSVDLCDGCDRQRGRNDAQNDGRGSDDVAVCLDELRMRRFDP